ncbi:MAG TPA: ubiquinol-cytochrome c reductase iron-sulfur subunit [Devosiaceae bacterium]|nr:ubiquinol-cytochrome c reductase iron-sulfur subunit [Devosiaceae bacterium]
MATDATTNPTPHAKRRDFLYVAAGAVGAVAVGAAVWPLINQLSPDASVLALASVDFDLSSLAPGQVVTIKWRGQPIFIRHRTPEDIKSMEAVPLSELKDPVPDSDRVKQGHEQYLVMIGICTHLGCVPLFDQGMFRDGWFCPCHGSQYDASGRIRQGPAPLNLVIPPYKFVSDTKITIG